MRREVLELAERGGARAILAEKARCKMDIKLRKPQGRN